MLRWSAHSSAIDVLKALPCSLFFSLKTHSALPRHPPPARAAEGLPQGPRDPTSGRAPHLPSLAPAPLAFFFLCKGLGGTGQPGVSERALYVPSRETPRRRRDTGRPPFRLQPRHDVPEPHQQAAASPSAPKGHFVRVFQFFSTSFKSLFPEEGPPGVARTRTRRRRQRFWVLLSIRTFLLYWSQPCAHSILFVDFWAHVFYGH